MTPAQVSLIQHTITVAENAADDLNYKGHGAPRARPTLHQLDRTVSRLQSIVRSLEAVLS